MTSPLQQGPAERPALTSGQSGNGSGAMMFINVSNSPEGTPSRMAPKKVGGGLHQKTPDPVIPGRHGEWRAVLEVPSKGPPLGSQGYLEALPSGQDAGRGSGHRDTAPACAASRSGSGPGWTLPGAPLRPDSTSPAVGTGLGQVQSRPDPRSSLQPWGPQAHW